MRIFTKVLSLKLYISLKRTALMKFPQKNFNSKRGRDFDWEVPKVCTNMKMLSILNFEILSPFQESEIFQEKKTRYFQNISVIRIEKSRRITVFWLRKNYNNKSTVLFFFKHVIFSTTFSTNVRKFNKSLIYLPYTYFHEKLQRIHWEKTAWFCIDDSQPN